MNLRELKYVILGEDKLSDKMQRISGASDKAKKSLGEHADKVGGLRKKYSEAADAVPVFGNAVGRIGSTMAAVVNPITIGVAAVAGIGLAMRKSAEEASVFEVQFRKLENINLDKTAGQIDGLRDRVLNIGFNKGFDPNKIAEGVFDIQSLTGNTGYGGDFIVSKQAEFARAAGADINKYIAGTGVAMKNFGFGPGQLEQYNKASMGLVATAKITYDQLAQVSSMYAGPAAAANQSFVSANKLMAVFTTKTKSAEEAATLTKSAFTDLFKKSTVDSFKSIGIDMYDVAGNAKQIDQILLELNKKFASRTSAKAMDELRNKFQGSEGINALLSAAKDQSGALLKSFDAFDAGGNGMAKMLASAKNDVNIIAETVEGRLKSATVAWGESVLPIKNWWNSMKADIIGSASMMLQKGYWSSGRSAGALYKDKTDSAAELESLYNSEMGVVAGAKDLTPEQFKVSQAYYRKLYAEAFDIVNKNAGDFVQIEAARNKMTAVQEVSKALQDAYYAKPAMDGAEGGDGTPTTDTNLKNGMAGISGGGVRNVTVTFKSLVENFNINTTNLTDSTGKIKTDIEAMLVKAIAGSEQMIGAN